MRQKDQKMRFNDAELGLFKTVFAENDDALFLVRKFLLQAELTKHELDLLKNLVSQHVYNLLRKTFIPSIDVDSPFFQVTDLVMGLSVDMKDKPVNDIGPFFMAKRIEINYLTEMFDRLNFISNGIPYEAQFKLSLKDLSRMDFIDHDLYSRILARNWLLSYIDSNMQQIKFLAGMKKESVEETIKNLQKNSNK